MILKPNSISKRIIEHELEHKLFGKWKQYKNATWNLVHMTQHLEVYTFFRGGGRLLIVNIQKKSWSSISQNFSFNRWEGEEPEKTIISPKSPTVLTETGTKLSWLSIQILSHAMLSSPALQLKFSPQLPTFEYTYKKLISNLFTSKS